MAVDPAVLGDDVRSQGAAAQAPVGARVARAARPAGRDEPLVRIERVEDVSRGGCLVDYMTAWDPSGPWSKFANLRSYFQGASVNSRHVRGAAQ